MTTPINPHPTKTEAKIFERYSWLPLVIALLIGAFWVIAKFRTHKLQMFIFAAGVLLLLGVEFLRWRRTRARTGEKLDSTTYIDGASSFSIGLIYGIGSALIVIPLLYAFAQWVHSHAIFQVNERLKDIFGGASPPLYRRGLQLLLGPSIGPQDGTVLGEPFGPSLKRALQPDHSRANFIS
ncbi:MAG: hypothetical protein NTU96_10275 [Actinobacteria bacterium]|nr:hypothetical protein [Actinomycetota bacterium]